jgi:hypothetical protein
MAARKSSRKKSSRKSASRSRASSRKTSSSRKSSTRKKSSSTKRYGEAASKRVESAMRRRKKGTLRSGPGGKGGRVKSRKQAIAIGLSEARKKGAKVPRRASSGRKKSRSR